MLIPASGTSNPNLEDSTILIKMHATLSTEVGLAVLSTINAFIQDHTSEMIKPDSLFLESVFNTLVMFLRTRQSKRTLEGVFKVMSEFINDFR